MKHTIQHFIYCKECNEYTDLYKYVGIEDTDHSNCKWRYVTEKELKGLIVSCRNYGCEV